MKMFRLICVVVIAAGLLAAPALAGPLGKTIKGGVSYAKVTNDQFDDSDREMGFAVGMAFSYDLVPGISLNPEVLYVQQGGKYEFTMIDEYGMPAGNAEMVWDLDYIQIPVLARVSLPVVGSVLPTLIAGPALSYNVKKEYTTEGSAGSVTEELDYIKDTDLSLIFGLGMKLGAGPAGVNLELRYNHGLTDLNDSVDGTAKIQNRSLQALVGVSF